MSRNNNNNSKNNNNNNNNNKGPKFYSITVRQIFKDGPKPIDQLFSKECTCICNCDLPFSNIRNKQEKQQNQLKKQKNSDNNFYEESSNQCYCNCECIDKDILNNKNKNIDDEFYNYFKILSCYCNCKNRDPIFTISRTDYKIENNCFIKYHDLDNSNNNSYNNNNNNKEIILENNKEIEIDYNKELFLKIQTNDEILNYHLFFSKIGLSTLLNYQFYKNYLPSRPNGDLIDNIHTDWYNDYSLLESHHGFVQWLFPLYMNNGMNYYASKLNRIESKLFRNDIDIAKRIVKSYELMLNFYGMKLSDKMTGTIVRHPDITFSNRRYKNLKNNGHNNLRISRIITFLGHVGFQRYKENFVMFLKSEIESKRLEISKYSLNNFWLPLIDHSNLKLYFETTLETDEDLNEESIYFYYLENHKDVLDDIHQAN